MAKKGWLLLFVVLGSLLLEAYSVKRTERPFLIGNTLWRKVIYEDDDIGFTVLMPDDPRSGSVRGDIFVHSKYQKAKFEVHTSISGRYRCPPTQDLFISQISSNFKGAVVKPIPTNQEAVLYVADIQEGKKMTRVFCSHNQLYWAIAQDADPEMTKVFFNSVRITK